MDNTYLLSVCAIALVFYLILKVKNRKYDQLRKKGKAGSATVISVTQDTAKLEMGSEKHLYFDFVLAINQPDASTITVSTTQSFVEGNQPNAGDKVDVLIDPANANNVVIKNNGYTPNKTVTIFGIDIRYRQTTYKSRY